MRHRDLKNHWKWFILFFGVFIIILMGLYIRMITVRSSALQSDFQRKPQAVNVEEPVRTKAWKTVTFLARVEGGQTIKIRSDVGGWVKEKKVDIGSIVEAEDILLILTDERKEFVLLEAESRLLSAKADLKELKRLYNKNISLVEKGIVAKDTLESLTNQIESKRAGVNALEASYQRAKWDVDHLIVSSPIKGKIINVLPDIGQEVMVNEIIIDLVNISNKRVVAGVDANWARILKGGTEVKLSNTVYGNLETTTAKIIGISPNIDIDTGTYSFEAEILDQNIQWLPGEIVNMEVPVEFLDNIIKVPRTAVLSDNEEVFLFAYRDGVALKVPVSVIWLNENEGAIPSGSIPQNSKIIVNGNSGLSNGQAVRVIQ